ncbi:MAG: hypothetical protein UHW86_01330 [Spirochaetota bacterium]|nr:hypothetical protein [Spirochaetota bacterium]
MKKMLLCLLFSVATCVFFVGCGRFGDCDNDDTVKKKPVIYLYPETATEVDVKLDYAGKLTCTYPKYQNGWNVIAEPDGTLKDVKTGKEYSYLFWEGESKVKYDLSKGYVVKGEDTAEFLQEKLAQIGLLPKEYNEFIVYWLPEMEDNPYNLITFQNEVYTNCAVLTVNPKPDSVLRVFMAYKELERPIKIESPEITPFERKGFTVVEWGGTEID